MLANFFLYLKVGLHGYLLELRWCPFRALFVSILPIRNLHLPIDLCLLCGVHGLT